MEAISKITKLMGVKIIDRLPKPGDTMICVNKNNFNYGITCNVSTSLDVTLIDTGNWKVIEGLK